MRAFAEALDAVPMALAENSGLSPIETLAAIKSRQVKEKNTRLGVDCMQTGSNGKPPFQSPQSLIPRSPMYIADLFEMRTQQLASHTVTVHRISTGTARRPTGLHYTSLDTCFGVQQRMLWQDARHQRQLPLQTPTFYLRQVGLFWHFLLPHQLPVPASLSTTHAGVMEYPSEQC